MTLTEALTVVVCGTFKETDEVDKQAWRIIRTAADQVRAEVLKPRCEVCGKVGEVRVSIDPSGTFTAEDTGRSVVRCLDHTWKVH